MDGSFEVVEKTREPHVRTRHRNSSKQDQRSSFGLPIYTAGNLAMQRLLRSGVIRPNLAVSQPGDTYEQEADGVERMCLACIIDLFASGVELTILSNRSK
jgi:hypothetical protein